MARKTIKIFLALILSMALLLGLAPVPAMAAAPKALTIAVVADPHFFGRAQADDYSEGFQRFYTPGKMFMEAEAILESTLASLAYQAEKTGLRYVIIPGDLTHDGEIAGHKALAARLERFEEETGIQVAVVPGNHDINTHLAIEFVDGKRQPAPCVTPEQYREIYRNLGYDLPNAAFFTPAPGKRGGGLSYAVDLGDGYRLIALDLCKYSADQNPNGDTYHTGGMVGDDLLAWAVRQAQDAVRAGKTVIGMGHHNLAPHMGRQDRWFSSFVMDDWQRIGETLADAGMHFYFSGHMHQNSINSIISDNGQVIYDIATGSIVSFPSLYRQVRFTSQGRSDIRADITVHDICEALPVHIEGIATHPQPFRKASFGLTFHPGGIAGMAEMLVDGFIGDMLRDMRDSGGLRAMLGDTLDDAIGGMLGDMLPIDLSRNVMGLAWDIIGQVDRHYIQNTDRTLGLLKDVVAAIFDIQVSELPSTRFLRDYGIGNANKPGTLSSLIDEAILYIYGRYTGPAQNRFLMDTLDGIENGPVMGRVADTLVEALLDLVQDEFLPTLRLNIAPVFTQPLLRLTVGALLDGLLRLLLWGDNSFNSLVNTVFDLGSALNLMPYNGLDEIVDGLLEDFLTDSLIESLGFQLGRFIREAVMYTEGDLNTTLRYTGRRNVIATQENLRLPSLLAQGLPVAGEGFDRVVSWHTKYSVTGTDIRIFDERGRDITEGLDITATRELVDLDLPGIDLGILSLLDVPAQFNRHRAEIRGLRPNRSYTYQVGCARRGWWSPEGRISGAQGGNWLQETTFLSFSNIQSQTPQQYARNWGALSQAALNKFPEAAFAVSADDHVANSTNFDQWQWFFDNGQKALLDLPLMPVLGNGFFPVQNENYAFEYNNIHVIMLGSGDLDAAWLRQAVDASDADWQVAVMHETLETGNRLFSELGIDVIVSGQEHSGPMFAAYATKGGTLAYEAWAMDSSGELSLLDTFEITKDVPAREAPEGWGLFAGDHEGQPRTGDPALLAVIPFSLMLAAGFALLMLRKKREEAAI